MSRCSCVGVSQGKRSGAAAASLQATHKTRLPFYEETDRQDAGPWTLDGWMLEER